MMKKIRILLLPLAMLLCGYVSAQTVTGEVTSASDGAAIPGVSVVVKGTTVGTTTNADGDYTLSGSDVGTGTLVFSFIGFETKEVAVGSQSTVNVALAEDIKEL